MGRPISGQIQYILYGYNYIVSTEHDYNYNLNFSEGDVITSGATLYLNEFKEPETINGVVQTPKVIIAYV